MNERFPTPAEAALIAKTFGLQPDEIPVLVHMEGGMTNHSFLFQVNHQKYILRVAGENSYELTNVQRHQEALVYQTVNDFTLTDEILTLDPDSGMKITRFWENARCCDAENPDEVRQCMTQLRQFHEKKLQVPHRYDVFREIRNFDHRRTIPSVYPDHAAVQRRCLEMEPILSRFEDEFILCHCDSVNDNFLFVPGEAGEMLRLIDWEYAGMHDPYGDISMFASYSCCSHTQVEQLMEYYVGGPPSDVIRLRVYGYLALVGMMWSNWCELKWEQGQELGDYALPQYRFATDYSRRFWELLSTMEGEKP